MRGQSSFEFIVLMAFGMLLMVILLLIGTNYTQDRVENQRQQALLSLGYTIQDELILATTVHEGYEHDFDLPSSIGRFNYLIDTYENSFKLSSGSQSYTFLTPPITGTFQKGNNTIRYDEGQVSVLS